MRFGPCLYLSVNSSMADVARAWRELNDRLWKILDKGLGPENIKESTFGSEFDFTPNEGPNLGGGSTTTIHIPLIDPSADSFIRKKGSEFEDAYDAAGIEMFVDVSDATNGRFCLGDSNDPDEQQLISLIPSAYSDADPGGTFRTPLGAMTLETGVGNVNFEAATHVYTFSGVTSSFPALKRVTTELQARLADDSAASPFRASVLRSTGGTAFYHEFTGTPTANRTVTAPDGNTRVASWGGDEGDGTDITISGNTTWNGVKRYRNITINTGVTLTHDAGRALRIVCTGTLTLTGTASISATGKGYAVSVDTTKRTVARGGSGGNGGGGGAGAGGGGGGGTIPSSGAVGVAGTTNTNGSESLLQPPIEGIYDSVKATANGALSQSKNGGTAGTAGASGDPAGVGGTGGTGDAGAAGVAGNAGGGAEAWFTDLADATAHDAVPGGPGAASGSGGDGTNGGTGGQGGGTGGAGGAGNSSPGTGGSGANGGAGGGIIVIECGALAGAGSIVANGAAGSTGGNGTAGGTGTAGTAGAPSNRGGGGGGGGSGGGGAGGGGGGGGGGYVLVLAANTAGWSGTVTATGGAGGAAGSVGSGGSGGAGGSGDGSGATGGVGGVGGAGGAGAAGGAGGDGIAILRKTTA